MAEKIDITKIVLSAFKDKAVTNFFELNEYITKRLVPGQYNQYPELASTSVNELILLVGAGVDKKDIRNVLNKECLAGRMKKKIIGTANVFWLVDTDFLQQTKQEQA